MKLSPAVAGKSPSAPEDALCVDPEKRLCPSYNYLSIAKYRTASRNEMGVQIIDNICEEHIM